MALRIDTISSLFLYPATVSETNMANIILTVVLDPVLGAMKAPAMPGCLTWILIVLPNVLLMT